MEQSRSTLGRDAYQSIKTAIRDGIYRPGERVRLIGLIRDQVGRAIANRQSTLVVYRPNGTEARRIRMTEGCDDGEEDGVELLPGKDDRTFLLNETAAGQCPAYEDW